MKYRILGHKNIWIYIKISGYYIRIIFRLYETNLRFQTNRHSCSWAVKGHEIGKWLGKKGTSDVVGSTVRRTRRYSSSGEWPLIAMTVKYRGRISRLGHGTSPRGRRCPAIISSAAWQTITRAPLSRKLRKHSR